MYEIEKNVPMPVTYRQHRAGLTRAIKALEIGDSFMMPPGKTNGLHFLANRNKIKISYNVQSDGNIRVWRVS